jgi:hypothetical protein
LTGTSGTTTTTASSSRNTPTSQAGRSSPKLPPSPSQQGRKVQLPPMRGANHRLSLVAPALALHVTPVTTSTGGGEGSAAAGMLGGGSAGADGKTHNKRFSLVLGKSGFGKRHASHASVGGREASGVTVVRGGSVASAGVGTSVGLEKGEAAGRLNQLLQRSKTMGG